MPFVSQNFSFICFLFCIALPCIIAGPIPLSSDSPYDKFIEYLLTSNCSMPKEVELPFAQSSDIIPFSYLSTPLKECQTSEAIKEDNKEYFLCKEVFDVLQNITCSENNAPLPKINSSHLSENTCNGFKAMKDVLPKRDDYLSGKLSNNVVCKAICTDKYMLLCNTLLWSYNTQAKIKNALETEVKEDEDKKGNKNDITSNKDASALEISVKPTETDLDKQYEKKFFPDIHVEDEKNSVTVSNLSNSELVSNSTKSSNLGETIINKTNSALSNQDGELINATYISESIKASALNKKVTQPENQKLLKKYEHKEDIPSAEPDLNLSGKVFEHEENSIEKQPGNVKIENPVTDISPITKISSLISDSGEMKENQNEENALEYTSPNKGKISTTDANKGINIKLKEKSKNPTVPNTDLNNVDLQEQKNETKIKEKQTNLKTLDKDKKIEKPKEEEFEISNAGIADAVSKALEATTLLIPADKSEDLEQHQEDKDQEQYNGGFSLLSKNKGSDVKSSKVAGSDQMSSNYDPDINSRNNLGRISDDIQMSPSFPEQEDSHFFFYFLSIVLILMAGYLIFHNKQKIIALIVEGRHERRRRSHGAGYKKLETK